MNFFDKPVRTKKIDYLKYIEVNKMFLNKNVKAIIAFLEKLPPHEKLQELSKVMLFKGRYRILKKALSRVQFYIILDLVNYSRILFPDPLPVKELLDIFSVEPGYGSLTGHLEIGDVIKELEIDRAYACANQYHLPVGNIRHVVQKTVVVTSFGATGAIYTLLMALLTRERATGRNRSCLVFNAPTYCLSDAFARLNGLTPLPVFGTRENGFFPPLAQVREACSHPSVFACILTYPNNPAQTSLGKNDLPELLRLVEYCQSNKIQLIADTVFQDLRWLSAPPVPELFALSDSSKYLSKIFSPSKDRPFASGYRIGYLMADKRLRPWLERVVSSTSTSPNTLSQIWLAIDAVFRRAMMKGELTPELFLPLKGRSIFGFGIKPLEVNEMYQRICDADLYTRYVHNLRFFNKTLEQNIGKVWDWLSTNEYFEVDKRPAYGNTLMVRVPKKAQFQNEFEYYFYALLTTGVIASTGGCFGMPNDGDIYFRVVMASYPPELVITTLDYVKGALINQKAPGYPLFKE